MCLVNCKIRIGVGKEMKYLIGFAIIAAVFSYSGISEAGMMSEEQCQEFKKTNPMGYQMMVGSGQCSDSNSKDKDNKQEPVTGMSPKTEDNPQCVAARKIGGVDGELYKNFVNNGMCPSAEKVAKAEQERVEQKRVEQEKKDSSLSKYPDCKKGNDNQDVTCKAKGRDGKSYVVGCTKCELSIGAMENCKRLRSTTPGGVEKYCVGEEIQYEFICAEYQIHKVCQEAEAAERLKLAKSKGFNSYEEYIDAEQLKEAKSKGFPTFRIPFAQTRNLQ